MSYKLQKTYIQIVGPHSPGCMNDWKSIEVSVEFAFGETPDFCPKQERFLLSASRFPYLGESNRRYWGDTTISEPQWQTVGNGIREYDMKEGLRALQAFNRYLIKLPVRAKTLPDLLAALLAHKKIKTLTYTYYPSGKSRSTDHCRDTYPAKVVYTLMTHWEELNSLPGRPAEREEGNVSVGEDSSIQEAN